MEHIQAEERRAAIPVTGKKGKLPGSESDVYMDGRASFTNTIMTVNTINTLGVRQVLFYFAHFTVREVEASRDYITFQSPRGRARSRADVLPSEHPADVGHRQKCPGLGKEHRV